MSTARLSRARTARTRISIRSIRIPILLLALTAPSALPLWAQAPAFRDASGHDFGERITTHAGMLRYLERLDAESPLVRVVHQGASWEGRELVVAIVTAPENHQRLDEIRRNAQRLADPRLTSSAEADAIIADQPAIVWIGGSIHGFELSGSEGALKLLEHLVTRDDPATRQLLRDAVVLIDPMLNPDGRDAFAGFNHERLGHRPNPSRTDWNNDFTRWESLKFRTGHYFFDTNRDWMAHTQPETRARMPVRNAWRPQVILDMHEMGSEVEFYFDPPSGVCCKFFPTYAEEWQQRFGLDFAAAFDSAGFHYTTGDMWVYSTMSTTGSGSYHGAVGMLFEQSGTRGLAITRSDGSVRRLTDGMNHHYVGALAVVRKATTERSSLLRAYYDAHAGAIADGSEGIRRFVVAPEGDPNLVAEAVSLLLRHGIEVDVLTEAARLDDVRDREGRSLGGREFPAGSHVIEAAQPRSLLIREFFEPKWDAPVTNSAFPLTHLFNLSSFDTRDGRALPVRRLDEPPPVAVGGAVPDAHLRLTAEGEAPSLAREEPVPARSIATADYAYLIDGRQAAGVAAAYHLLEQGYRAAVTLRETRVEGVDYTPGTVVVRVGGNRDGVHEAVRELAGRYRLDVTPVATGLADPGYPALGSGRVLPLRRPSIAILAEGPVDPLGFGGVWYTLDRLYQIPTTVIRAPSLSPVVLRDFNVLVLPPVSDDGLRELLGEEGLEDLRRWVRQGGTLVAVADAAEFAREEFELDLTSYFETPEGEGAEPRGISGGIYPAEPVPGHWLGVGYPGPLPVFVNSSRIYSASGGGVAARYAPAHPAGDAVPERFHRLGGGVVAYEESVGAGRVVVLAEEVNFRGYWRGADRLFLNAVILGAS